MEKFDSQRRASAGPMSGIARVLISEYVKFLPAAARAATARLVRGWNGNSLAQVPGNRPTKL